MASLCGSSWAPFMRWRPIRKVMLKETERLLEKSSLTPSLTFHKKSGSYEDLRSGSLHPDTPMTPKEEERYGFVRLGSLRGSRRGSTRTVELLGTDTMVTLEDTVEKPSETFCTPTKSIPSVDSSVMKTPLSVQNMDSVLNSASLEKPALGLGVPLLVVRSYQPFVAKPGECNRNSDVAVKRGEPVIALFARGEWLFVRTVQCQQGFVPRHCCAFRWNNSPDAPTTPTDDDVSPPHVYEPIVTVSRLKLDLSRLNVSGEGSSDSGFSSPSLCQDPKGLRRLRTRSRKPVCMKDKTSLSLTQMELDVTATPRVSLCGLSDLQLSSIQGTPQWRPINHEEEEEDDELSLELIEKDSLRRDETIEQCDEEQEEEETAHEVTILFNYEAAFCGDLAVNCGERVQMLPSNHPEWLRVRNSSGREGFIPRTHIVDLNSLKKSPFVAKHTAL